MSLVKGEGPSRYKGKEIVVDESPMEAEKVEESPHFESDCSVEKEVSRDLDSECTPLIDLWYNIYLHFSVVPSDYSPSLPGRVWLSIEWCDSDISLVGFLHP